MQQPRPHTTPAAQVAAAVLVLAGLLGLAGLGGPLALAAGTLLAGLVIAWGWAGALLLPSPRGTAVVLGVTAVLVAASTPGEDAAWESWLPAAAAGGILLALLHQLVRRDGRPRVARSVSSVVLAQAVLVSGALLVPLVHVPLGSELVLAAMAGTGGSAVTDLAGRWPGARPWLVPMALVAGAAAALATAVLAGSELAWTTVLLLGVAVGAVSHAVRAVLSVLPSMAAVRPRLVTAAASILAVGPVVYTIARVLVPESL